MPYLNDSGFYDDPAGAGITNINVSAGTTSNNLSNLVFSNSNGISFGLGGSTITASHNGLTSQSNQAVSAANGSYAFQTLSFSNANGVSFGTSAGSAITASHNALTSQSNQAVSAANGSYAFQTLSFSNANGVSFGTSAGSAVTASVAAQTNQTVGLYASSNTTLTSSGTLDARSFSVRGIGVASVGYSAGELLISVPAGGGGLTNINVSAGTTSNNLSNVVFSNSNGVSFGLNGSTITASAAAGAAPTISWWRNLDIPQSALPFTSFSKRPIFWEIDLFAQINGLKSVEFILSRAAGVSLNMTHGVGIYTFSNSTRADLVSSDTHAISLTASSQFRSARIYQFTGLSDMTLSAGKYLMAYWQSGSNNSTAVANVGPLCVSTVFGLPGTVYAGTDSTAATNATNQVLPFMGFYTATTEAIPSSLNRTDIAFDSSAGNPEHIIPFVQLRNA